MWGLGAIMIFSKKQRIATKDSTEAELVGLSDFMAKVEWGQEYLLSRGHKLNKPLVLCDNTSTITIVKSLEKKMLRNRHLTARRGILHEQVIEDDYVDLKYISTKEMIADVLTKPVQGNLFTKLTRAVMGWAT